MRFTNLTWVVFIGLTTPLLAQTTVTNQEVRQISLDDCIRQALEHNFDIQIELTKPRLAQYDLQGSYALYEPAFEVTAGRNHLERPGTFRDGVIALATEDETDTLRSSIVGQTPWGLGYDIGYEMFYQESTTGPVTNRITGDEYQTGASIELTQPLLRDFWIDNQRADIRIFRRNLQISEYDVQYRMMQVVRDVQVAYYDLIAALDEVKVREKALELAQQLFEENRKRVEAGVLAPLDEKQAESEVAVARGDLIAARRAVLFQENVVKNLVSDNYSQWHAIRLEPTERLLAMTEMFSRRESWTQALTMRPDFNRARVEVEKQGILVKLGFNQLFPSLDLLGEYGRTGYDDLGWSRAYRGVRDEDYPNYFFGARLTVPLGFQRERNRYRSAKEQMRELELRLSQLHQFIVVQVDDSITLAEANFQQIPARREARLFAEAALAAEQKKLENGKSTSFFVLQLQRDLTSARAAEIRALAEYNKALAEYYFSEGTILDRNSIAVDFR